ncbi:MAG: hypothetical protein ACKVWV_20355 [Planctomycetota bacterium]
MNDKDLEAAAAKFLGDMMSAALARFIPDSTPEHTEALGLVIGMEFTSWMNRCETTAELQRLLLEQTRAALEQAKQPDECGPRESEPSPEALEARRRQREAFEAHERRLFDLHHNVEHIAKSLEEIAAALHDIAQRSKL